MITNVQPMIEPLSPMQSNNPLIMEKIQYIIYTINRPIPAPKSNQNNNEIIISDFYDAYFLLGFFYMQRYELFPS